MKDRFALRTGEMRLPAPLIMGAELTFIGHIESPWSFADCPKNLFDARARGTGLQGVTARVHVDEPFRPGLEGLSPGDALVLLYWMDRAPRDLIRQAPRHHPEGRGTFALRSPARPNPIGMGIVQLQALDAAAGILQIDAIDAVNGTALIDIKPHMPRADQAPT